jgi:hypothetical protein
MAEYREVVLRSGASGGARCEITVVRARLLGLPVEWVEENLSSGGMIAFYEEEGSGEIIVYEEEWFRTIDYWTVFRWWRATSLDELRRNTMYRAILEQAGL